MQKEFEVGMLPMDDSFMNPVLSTSTGGAI
jgi:hypothetical protein